MEIKLVGSAGINSKPFASNTLTPNASWATIPTAAVMIIPTNTAAGTFLITRKIVTKIQNTANNTTGD